MTQDNSGGPGDDEHNCEEDDENMPADNGSDKEETKDGGCADMAE